MGKDTKIEWADHTFNCWRGCSKVSEACRNCYAETQAKRNPGVLGVWGDNGTRVVASEATWKEPLKWDREAKAAGVRRRVFCASMADVFEDWRKEMLSSNGNPLWWCGGSLSNSPVPKGGFPEGIECRWATMQDVRRRLFSLIDATPNLDWMLLTKRPEDVAAMMPVCNRCDGDGKAHGSDRPFEWSGPGTYPGPCPVCKGLPRHNVWLGTTVENQQAADERIPHLLRVPAVVRFLSCEPLLGPINLVPHRNADGEVVISQGIDVDWVIAGGESGPHARPSHPDWFRSLRDQCQAAGVPFHFKQWGSWEPVTPLYNGRDDTLEDGTEIIMQRDGLWNERDGQPTDSRAWLMRRVGKSSAGRMLDGRTWDEVPSLTFAPDA